MLRCAERARAACWTVSAWCVPHPVLMHTYTMHDLLYSLAKVFLPRGRACASPVGIGRPDVARRRRRRLCKCDLSGLDEGDEGLHDVPAILAELSLGDRLVELHLRPHVSR